VSIKVFIADDHAMMREGLRLIIEAERDISVVGEAADGRQAVRLIQRLAPDVVIMDIAMPILNGIEAAGQILDSKTFTRIIILSMHSSKEHIFRALEAGAKGYLLKESAGNELVKAIRAVYAGNRFLSDRISQTVIEDYIHQRTADSEESPIKRLSPREREVLQLVVEGKSSAEIASNLFLSPKTIETYRSRLMHKLGIKDLPGLVKFAIQHGMTSVE
jgi:DNA-binding NarL/FixJ family response regulator